MVRESDVLLVIGSCIAGGLLLLACFQFSNSKSSQKSNKKPSKKSTGTTSSSSANFKKSVSSNDKVIIDDEDEDLLKGYKVTAKGMKTTYFSKELSEQEKQLLGDNSPKRIDATVTPVTSTSGSAWNQAGTWEDRDCSAWATERITTFVRNIASQEHEDAVVSVTNVMQVTGDASITTIRGSKKYLVDFSFEVHWFLQAKTGRNTCSGVLRVNEVTAEREYEFTASVKESVDGDLMRLYRAYIVSDKEDERSLQRQIVLALER